MRIISVRTSIVSIVLLGLVTVAMISFSNSHAPKASAGSEEQNPLLMKWTGPYGGLPPFDKVKVEHFKPALEAGMKENLAEIEAIANNPKAPTFNNTIAAMERAGSTLERVSTIYSTLSGTMSTPELRAVEREMGPKLAAFSDTISQNEKLFKRIESVYKKRNRHSLKLTAEQKRLTWRYYTNFVRAGAKLNADQKKRLSEICLLYTSPSPRD